MNTRVRNERDKLQFEKRKLQEKVTTQQRQIDLLQSKLDEKEESSVLEELAHNRSISDLSSSGLLSNPPPFTAQKSSEDPESNLSPHLSPHSNAASGYSFENLMYNLISNRQRLQKKEEEVKNRMAELEAEDNLINFDDLVTNEDDVDLEPPEFYDGDVAASPKGKGAPSDQAASPPAEA